MDYSLQNDMNFIDNKIRNSRYSNEEDEKEIFNKILEFYLDYIDDENLGKIANSHLAFAD
jgi:hypothetical protein